MPGHVHNGSTQVEGIVRIHNGSAWSDENDNLYAHDGSGWRLIQPYASSALNPPTGLVVSGIGPETATVNWTNPAQTITPTHVQVRVPEETTVWTEYDYPYAGGFTWPTLTADTDYQFQVRYLVRVNGIETLTSAAASVFFRTLVPDAPSVPAPGPTGTGPTSTFKWPTPPGGGASCNWEYIVQKFTEVGVGGAFGDTAITGTQSGMLTSQNLDLVALGIPCGTVCRFKYRENCGGVLGPYKFGPTFVVACDYGATCGGVATSATFLQTTFNDAILAIPQVCWDVALDKQVIEDYKTKVDYAKGPGYASPGFAGADWVLNGLASNLDSGTAMLIGKNTAVDALTGDFSFTCKFLINNLPAVGPSPSTKVLSIGKIINVRAAAASGAIKVSVSMPKLGGGSVNLVQLSTAPLNTWIVVAVTVDQDGDKILNVNGNIVATDTSGVAVDMAKLTGDVEMWGNQTARLGPVGGWSRLLTSGEIALLGGYDGTILQLGALFYARLDQQTTQSPPMWITYSAAIVNQPYLEVSPGYGKDWVKAWTNEYTSMAWPTFAQAGIDDAFKYLGPYWFTAYWAQATKPTYDQMVQTHIGALFFARCDVLDGSTSTLPVGGVVTVSGGYVYHTLKQNEVWYSGRVAGSLAVDYILVGGGGSGGGGGTDSYGGGGGGGEAIIGAAVAMSADSYPFVRGAGGASAGSGAAGNVGGVSTFNGQTAQGGAGGGCATVSGGAGGNGVNGAQGGGGGGRCAPSGLVDGPGGTSGTGFAGGTASSTGANTQTRGGGGGGAGQVGGSGSSAVGGNGVQWPAGSGTYYAGGGSGGWMYAFSFISGGTGGGGSGSDTGSPGQTNTGGGGGSGRATGQPGGSGVLIVRYPT